MTLSKQNGRPLDPIVAEVRAVREAIDEDVGHDLVKLAERARRAGEEYRRSRGLKPVQPADVCPSSSRNPELG